MHTVLALVLVVLLAAAVYVCWPTPGTAYIRIFSYPAADLTIDETRTMETPTSGAITLGSGRHTFDFRSRTGGLGMSVTVKLRKNRRYLLNVDLESGRHELED